MLFRAYPSYFDKAAIETGQTEIVYRMINNKYQLKEKMAPVLAHYPVRRRQQGGQRPNDLHAV